MIGRSFRVECRIGRRGFAECCFASCRQSGPPVSHRIFLKATSMIIVWNGYGWYIPVFCFGSLGICEPIREEYPEVIGTEWLILFSMILATVLVLGLTIVLEVIYHRKTPPAASLRPDLLLEHWIKYSPDSFFFIPVRYWSPIIALCAAAWYLLMSLNVMP